jgi:hypothetical protein
MLGCYISILTLRVWQSMTAAAASSILLLSSCATNLVLAPTSPPTDLVVARNDLVKCAYTMLGDTLTSWTRLK